jgi:hypothetical protein
VKGPTSCTAILIHRKEELQMEPRRIKLNQDFAFTPSSSEDGDECIISGLSVAGESFQRSGNVIRE